MSQSDTERDESTLEAQGPWTHSLPNRKCIDEHHPGTYALMMRLA